MKNQETINTNKRKYLDAMQRIDYNVIKINIGNTKEHEMKKCDLAYDLIKGGNIILTETKLKNGKRPDIIVMDTVIPIAIEVMKSEKESSIKEKEKNYMGMIIKTVKA